MMTDQERAAAIDAKVQFWLSRMDGIISGFDREISCLTPKTDRVSVDRLVDLRMTKEAIQKFRQLLIRDSMDMRPGVFAELLSMLEELCGVKTSAVINRQQ